MRSSDMSNSYKKNPWVNDHKRKVTKSNKREANKEVRRVAKKFDDVGQKAYYKKMTESWDITDYKQRWTKEEAKQEYENGELSDYIYKHYPTLEKWLHYWEKCCYRK